MDFRNIEKFFLNTLLRISIIGVAIVMVSDLVLFPEDRLSLVLDAVILGSCLLSYIVRKTYPAFATLLITIVVTAAMVYQCIVVPINTTTSLSIMLLVGFIYSVMLRGALMLVMHAITLLSLNVVFVVLANNSAFGVISQRNEIFTIAVTYNILYFLLTYATAALKFSYDKINGFLREMNNDLNGKANELEMRNNELVQIQNNLNGLNLNLEKIVNERTEKIRQQNEVLIKYSYANAHHLRGPVARLLGLASVYRLGAGIEVDFIIEKMVDQANEIDMVVKQINKDLEMNHTDAYVNPDVTLRAD